MLNLRHFVSLHKSAPLTSVRVASVTPSLKSMRVPSDLQRGRAVLVVFFILWAAILSSFAAPSYFTQGFPYCQWHMSSVSSWSCCLN